MANRCLGLSLLWLITLSTMLFAVVPAPNNDSWAEIGYATARMSENSLMIYPKDDIAYSKLRFQIEHGKVILNQARVYLVDGSVFRLNLQKTLKGDTDDKTGYEYSQVLPLVNAQQKPIKKVEVAYKFKMQKDAFSSVVLQLQGIPVK